MRFNYNFNFKKSNTPSIRVNIFNKIYFELLDIMSKNNRNNQKFCIFYNKNKLIKNMNPTIFIDYWYDDITLKYYNEIMNEDVDLFLSQVFTNKFSKTQFIEYNIYEVLKYMKDIYPYLSIDTIEIIQIKMKTLTAISKIYKK